MRTKPYIIVVCAAIVAFGALWLPSHATQEEINIYSSRKTYLIEPILRQFTEQTGVKVNLITDKAGKLIARLEQEAHISPADVLITTDVGNLQLAKEKGLFQPTKKEAIQQAIPSHLRDADHYWFGLTTRTRALFYAKNRVNKGQLGGYESLADPKWKGKILIRSATNIYNQSLIASRIAKYGEKQTRQWLNGIVTNFARSPKGGDTDQLRAIAKGEGDIAVANSYYYGRLQSSTSPEDQKVVKEVGIHFPNPAHINISGLGIMKHAPNKTNAIKLLEFLLQKNIQEQFANLNHEEPVVLGVERSPVVTGWGKYPKDSLPLSTIAKYNQTAIRLAEQAGWR